MPTRSLHSSVLRWPKAETVIEALTRWAQKTVKAKPEVLAIGYFGSYARGDQGVGSDLDVLIIVRACETPFNRRAALWDLTDLPLPADALVYTQAEWQALDPNKRFQHMLLHETVWVCGSLQS